VVKSYVGPAILYLPHAFCNGGMLPSLLLLPFLGGLTTAAFYLLIQCHTCAAGAPTYADMAALALGRPGRLAVTAALVGAQLSTITSYYMFVARNLRDSASLYGWALPPDTWLIPLLMPAFAPLSCVPQVRVRGRVRVRV
jgi:amino acid permease